MGVLKPGPRVSVLPVALGGTPKTYNSVPCRGCRKRATPDCTLKASKMYTTALELAREERFEDARSAFEETISACPCWQKPWVSYAQMEKRAARRASEERWTKCREVLQRALVLNPSSPQVICAWGLMELQRGNNIGAVKLLERCASFDPDSFQPVLRWKPVRDARQTVSQRQGRTLPHSTQN